MLAVLLHLLLHPGLGVSGALDPRAPLVKRGPPGSLFGLSVALHQQTHNSSAFLLLVGAPKDKAEPHVRANHTDTDLNETEDLIEDMWLGVSVASQKHPAGPILVCGHRFVKLYGASNLRHMIGRCYLRGNDLQHHPTSMHWQNPHQVCSHIGDVSGEVMCNMGISADISQTEVLVGAPGSYEWQGNVHAAWKNPQLLYDPERSSFPNMGKRHAYIGYSVVLATHLLSKDAVTIVTGSVFLAERRNQFLVVSQSLHGQQLGSYYGNALAITDLNNDGWSELLVGAPFFFSPEEEQGGAVYVYHNLAGSLQLLQVLHGPPGSAFGMALSSAGDLDQDGYQDFAVGAPFYQTGSVYIWTGSATGISQEPSQVIRGSEVFPGFRTFGFSLSGGLDVDQNLFPDLLVGSLDDTVALLRARTVIRLNQTLTVTPEILDPASCDDLNSSLENSDLQLENPQHTHRQFALDTNFFLRNQPISSQFGGHVIGESAVKRSGHIGSPLLFTLQVDVVGKPRGSPLHLEVEFSWPLESTSGKWLLYLTEIRLDGTSEQHCITPGNIINPLNLTVTIATTTPSTST
ncbi:hypothetical protein NHX12_031553 [Muraenolepis orangiensis]|uniref:Integrin alpha third immunoglobulin-like domain-containing protein n=1 Tax=Muraenolepis orangiensis TaxID=630683 RepID=A0A9Q0E7P5_9TELE|nr:hypothetical protein NHX12_031553 [Muraenolepis orangiensis]